MSRRLPILTVVMVLLVGLLATSALASPPASDGEPGLSTKIDNRTDPLTEEQTELKAKAMDSVLNGKAKTDGKTLEVAKGQFVELAREGEDPVWTVLGEFGDFPHN
ncbi:MAG: peptidase M6, partial [Acidimicrobiia bacterium]